MPPNWWTRNSLVVAVGVVALLCAFSLAVLGTTPEPVASAALGPDWQCSRLMFVFTTCSRVKHSQSTAVRVAKIPVCGRLRT